MVDVQGKIVDRLETAETLGYSVKSEKRSGGAFRGNGVPPSPILDCWLGTGILRIGYWKFILKIAILIVKLSRGRGGAT
jgi:hypothetical protein